jgi:hypothetical protein
MFSTGIRFHAAESSLPSKLSASTVGRDSPADVSVQFRAHQQDSASISGHSNSGLRKSGTLLRMHIYLDDCFAKKE